MKRMHAVLAATLLSTAVAGGALAQSGPPFDPQQLPAIRGKVAQYSLTPRGDLNRVLLEDGTIIRLPREETERLADQLAPGQPLYVEGDGVAGPLGKAIAAQRIDPNQSQLAHVQEAPTAPRGARPDRREPPPPPPSR